MRAILSFVRASAIGIAGFVTFTAALCIALSIAIAGPPTAEEMAGVRSAVGELSRTIDGGLRRMGEEVCGSPELSVLCADSGEETSIARAEASSPPSEPPREEPEQELVIVAAEPPVSPEPGLLGGADARPTPPRRVERAPPPRHGADRRASDHRRPAARPRTMTRAPPPLPPLRASRQTRADSLPVASDVGTLADVRSMPETRLRHPEPAQDEQPARRWDEDAYGEDDVDMHDVPEDEEYEDYYQRDPYDEWW